MTHWIRRLFSGPPEPDLSWPADDAVRVAICGAPQVGKSEILLRLAALNGWNKPVWVSTPDPFATLEGQIEGRKFRFRAATGSVLYFEKMAAALLTGAHLVVYVINPKSKVTNPQQEYLEMHLKEASKAGMNWKSGKWLLVLNKTDLGDHCPFLARFPSKLTDKIVKTQALNGLGLDELLARIKELSPPQD